jgi:hypothetical protein
MRTDAAEMTARNFNHGRTLSSTQRRQPLASGRTQNANEKATTQLKGRQSVKTPTGGLLSGCCQVGGGTALDRRQGQQEPRGADPRGDRHPPVCQPRRCAGVGACVPVRSAARVSTDRACRQFYCQRGGRARRRQPRRFDSLVAPRPCVARHRHSRFVSLTTDPSSRCLEQSDSRYWSGIPL